ncbi:hypothetical protein GCM10027047_13280 [Rhodococcus aerolatus]
MKAPDPVARPEKMRSPGRTTGLRACGELVIGSSGGATGAPVPVPAPWGRRDGEVTRSVVASLMALALVRLEEDWTGQAGAARQAMASTALTTRAWKAEGSGT